MLCSHFYFFHPIVIDFISAAGQSDHAQLFINHNVSHAFAIRAAEIGTHTNANKSQAHILKTHTHKNKKRVPAVRKRATVLPTSTVA